MRWSNSKKLCMFFDHFWHNKYWRWFGFEQAVFMHEINMVQFHCDCNSSDRVLFSKCRFHVCPINSFAVVSEQPPPFPLRISFTFEFDSIYAHKIRTAISCNILNVCIYICKMKLLLGKIHTVPMLLHHFLSICVSVSVSNLHMKWCNESIRWFDQ